MCTSVSIFFLQSVIYVTRIIQIPGLSGSLNIDWDQVAVMLSDLPRRVACEPSFYSHSTLNSYQMFTNGCIMPSLV